MQSSLAVEKSFFFSSTFTSLSAALHTSCSMQGTMQEDQVTMQGAWETGCFQILGSDLQIRASCCAACTHPDEGPASDIVREIWTKKGSAGQGLGRE